MTADIQNRSAYKCYPFLTNEEFAEVCHYLDAKYCQATLGSLRKQWRLNVHTALDTSATSRADLVTFLQITKPFENNKTDEELARSLSNVALDEPLAPTRRSTRRSTRQSTSDSMMIDAEEADKEVLRYSSRANFQSSYVVYEIHLHPTYRAPCLWFSLHNLPVDESPLDIEAVFRHLVPDHFKYALRGQGAIGGISIEVSEPPVLLRQRCTLIGVSIVSTS
ncbi:putative ubiquitin-like-conjugating enzyme ATG10 [Rosellinia necatrix]|uniref:Putative ubiquitin-like-conjugating enzyme ATG10 n=1 Tax=Rosellinia necatrix TaxID=77044 RepID=A0A1W2TQ17_ROSNE|nr:putative ubiquitin-like-conjugating enzyme ATG10 [Rosellinia necatrix]